MIRRLAPWVLLAIAIALAIYAELQRREAARQAGLVAGPHLAMRALLLAQQAPERLHRNALLALDAYARAPSVEIGAILRRMARDLPPLPKEIAHEKALFAVAFDGEGRLLTGGTDGTVRAWDLEHGGERLALPHRSPVHQIAVSADSAWIATREYNPRSIAVWSAATGEQHALLAHGGSVGDLAFSPSGSHIVLWGYQGPATVWSVASGEKIFETPPEEGVASAAFGRGHELLATAGSDSPVRVWEIASGTPLFERLPAAVQVAMSADGELVAAGDTEGVVRLWTLAGGEPATVAGLGRRSGGLAFALGRRLIALGPEAVHLWPTAGDAAPDVIRQEGLRQVEWSESAGLIATADRLGLVRIANAEGAELAILPHPGAIERMAFDREGQRLATVERDGMARVWDLRAAIGARHGGPAYGVAFLPDGRRLLSAGSDRTTRLWDVEGQREQARFDHTAPVRSLAVAPDGSWFAAGDGDGMARVWTTDGLHERLRLPHVGAFVMFAISAMAASPDSSFLATAASDDRARLWLFDLGLPAEAIETEQGDLFAVAFSPDGKRLATGGRREVRLWDVASLEPAGELEHDGSVRGLQFAPDGVLASGASDGVLRLWEPDSQEPLAEIVHEGPLHAVAFSPDGLRLATTGADRTARVWQRDTREELARILLRAAGNAVAFSPDGERLATADDSGRIELWPLADSDLIAEVCSRVPRELTAEEIELYLGGEELARPCSKQ